MFSASSSSSRIILRSSGNFAGSRLTAKAATAAERRHCLFRGSSRQRRWHASAGRKTSSSTESNPSAKTSITSLLIGSVAGICGSLAGMGGGFIMIPLMTSGRLLKLNQHAAHGTSLFAVATTGLAGALGYSGQVDYEAATAIAISGMFSARLGALATTRLSETALRKALGVFMLLVAPLVPAKQYLVGSHTENDSSISKSTTIQSDAESNNNQQQSDSSSSSSSPSPFQRYIVPAAIGSCSGFLAGLFGVGGGAVVVPALTVCTDMNHYQALGTSLTAMVLPALSGTLTHYGKGNVNVRIAPFLAAGAFMGAYAGSKLALTCNEDKLKWGFSGVMVVLGVRALVI